MSLKPPPMFMGQHTIASGRNDKVAVFEDDGAGHTETITCTLTPGTYYVGLSSSESGSLLEHIKTQMESASDAGSQIPPVHGSGLDYELVLDVTTGKLSISCDAAWGSPFFYPILTHAGAVQKALCGGDPGAAGDGTRLANHLGWNQDAVMLSNGTTFTSDVSVSNSWWPDRPPAEDDPNTFEYLIIESENEGGDVQTYDFTGDEYSSDGSNNYSQIRTLDFQMLSAEVKDQFLFEFHWYAKQGLPDGRFRFYDDRTIDSYVEYGLTRETIKTTEGWKRDTPGTLYWNKIIRMRKYKA